LGLSRVRICSFQDPYQSLDSFGSKLNFGRREEHKEVVGS